MTKTKLISVKYKYIIKPILFRFDAEIIHNLFSAVGEFLGSYEITKTITSSMFNYENTNLEREIDGIKFPNPIGLSAGFDYDGHLAEIMKSVGFGFNTVGTVTAREYEGNQKPRLKRLPKSKSLLVNKGFKSEGVDKVIKRLESKNLTDIILGVSVGSSNLPSINTIPKAIDDYIYTFDKLKNKSYIKYFELNISCPNAEMSETFAESKNLKQLLQSIEKLKIQKPIYIKMANELSLKETENLVELSIKFNFIKGFIFSNLVKKRTNKSFDQNEIKGVEQLKGNFSGKPTQVNSNELISHISKKFGNKTTIIGCGGIFNAKDAQKKLDNGAKLVQLVTGMIFEGPQLIGEINEELAHLP
ncbi:hypothetical protein CO058_02155 [candidate division WWE3 bacterium CG_4_9_14_0_2_um_filter_35_11]|uniref:Dihydroorotate dehydrogenase (quinone) n=1 Tax=candidate division WWE3 bacterium CG_4_9_14_0_2_um_filter_35_11 TaxID=1975077 RepID=A0A2M8ELN5_UNCKA|nr:MAG: hypothetical protein COV25_00565 [candidate division WWE3 bacterium CG10_big_fil_rev_8_21_14_0_10_35_32]PJC23653.1 MAG: hypothetical protein CO058_02155 [candidate division WWE3 bacterium CG_4_9_14_0_2_um_filter_35_11]